MRPPRAIAAEAQRRELDIELVRNGSRGLLWLEPLVEVERRAAAHRLRAGEPITRWRACSTPDLPRRRQRRTPLQAHGPTEEIPYFKNQERLTFARVGIIDPRSLDDYLAHGGYRGLAAALDDGSPRDIVASVTDSGLRGRGGAAFPAGIKWKTVLERAGRAEVHRLQCR